MSRTKILGSGRRARPVTVTLSSQDELMSAVSFTLSKWNYMHSATLSMQLFPTWLGRFEGTTPSVRNLSNADVIATLERGVMDRKEVEALSRLLHTRDVSRLFEWSRLWLIIHYVFESHYIKNASLPFWKLISILLKFPGDHIFWSRSLTDSLYSTCFTELICLWHFWRALKTWLAVCCLRCLMVKDYLLSMVCSCHQRCPFRRGDVSKHFDYVAQ